MTVGGQQKPAVRVQVDPAKLAAVGLQLEDVANVITTATVDAPKGPSTAPRRASRSTTTTSSLKAAPWNDVDRRLPQWCAGPHQGHRRCGRRAREHPAARLGRTARRHPAARSTSSPAQRDRYGQARQGGAAARCRPAIPPSVKIDQLIDRTTTIRASVERRRVHAAAHHQPGGAGDLPLPAQLLGDDHSRHHRAAVAARHRGAHVHGRLQPRQSLADGAHHRGRLRRRRCHRHAREHLPPHRGRA